MRPRIPMFKAILFEASRRSLLIGGLPVALCFVVVAANLVHTESKFQLSSTEWDFSLKDVKNQVHHRKEWESKRAVVIFFLEPECPISNRYSPEINRIVAEYSLKNFAFYGVQSDPLPDAQSRVLKASRNFGYAFPILLDPTQILATRSNVTVTPEVAIFSQRGELLYHGRIDDLYRGLGVFRDRPTRHDLRLTLDAIEADLPIPNAATKAIGCYLPSPAKS